MTEQDIFDAHAMMTKIWALLYENFDAEPEWRPVVIKDLRIGPEGIDSLELMILSEEGWPTPWHAVLPRATFATSLRKEKGHTG